MRFVKSFNLALIFTLIFSVAALGQITFEPAFATENDSVVIVFDATKGNGELEGFTGEVFLWTGPITNESAPAWASSRPSEGWDTNFPEELKAEPLGDNKWTFTYGPSVREFFSITDPNVQIERIGVLFRGVVNGTTGPVGRAEGGADIFIDLFEPGLQAKFLELSGEESFIRPNESIVFDAIAGGVQQSIDLMLLKDGNQVASVTDDTLRYTFTPTSTGTSEFVLQATDESSNTVEITHTVFVNEASPLQERPPNTKDGITYLSDSSVRLSLFAPGKDFIYLIGDFNNWEVQDAFLMKRDSLNADSTWFWIDVEGLAPGQKYGFQYLVDGQIRVTDPYSELVLHPNDDQFIPETVFPDIPPYPAGKTDFEVGVLTPGEDEYQWEITDFDRPDPEELVIYELLVRDFVATHSYETLIDTLDYIDSLGINAIELMPVMEFNGNSSWGYNPTFHLALDKYYGTENAFKRFIDEAHKRGIAIILDIVPNHADGPSPLVRLWNEGDFGRPTPDNPYLNVESPNQTFSFFNDFNHESKATQYWLDRMNRFWVEEYNIDGYRFDFTKGITQTPGDGGSFDQSRIDLLIRMADELRKVDPDLYLILEHFAPDSEEQVLTNDGMMVWGNVNFEYRQLAEGRDSDLTRIHHSTHGFDTPSLIGYMESHDEERLMFSALNFGLSEGDYNIQDAQTAINRMKLGAAFFFTVPGPKMIWQFGELGYDFSIDFNGRVGEKPIRWDYFENPVRKNLYKTYKALIRLRNSSPAFSEPVEYKNFLNGSDTKWIRLEHPDTDVFVVGNVSTSQQSRSAFFTKTGIWYDFFRGDSIQVSDTGMELIFEPGEFKIYTSKRFPPPEEGIATSNDEEFRGDIPKQFQLYQNYPNPFNPSTNLRFDLPIAGEVRMEVFDISGRKISTLIDERMNAGTHTIRFDASALSSGIYLVRLRSGSFTKVQKITLIK